jgi:peptidoglycan/xylan/chitin deacetylase (PgdA/CDA1 family)
MALADIGTLPERPHRPLVLLYHRVANLDVDPWRLAVRPPDFERHIRFLSSTFDIVPLASLIPERGPVVVRPGAIAITFDDGYRDNFDAAWPVLERYRVPATFFICSSALESSQEFWWDRLERALLFPGRLPGQISIGSGASAVSVRIAETDYSEADFLRHRSWNVDMPPPTSRHTAFVLLWMRLRSMSGTERDRAMDGLRDLSDDVTERTSHCPMSVDELRQMAASDIVEIGAHTVTHGRLATLPEREQRLEIEGSRHAVERSCGRAPTSFSYPFGSADDFSDTTMRIVAESGFQRACAARGSTIDADANRFAVPRCFVAPGGVSSLVKQLTGWLAQNRPPRR